LKQSVNNVHDSPFDLFKPHLHTQKDRINGLNKGRGFESPGGHPRKNPNPNKRRNPSKHGCENLMEKEKKKEKDSEVRKQEIKKDSV
jgi:hypothetical protein